MAAGGGKLKLSQRGLIKDEKRFVIRHLASTESGPYRMEKHEGDTDTSSQEVLE